MFALLLATALLLAPSAARLHGESIQSVSICDKYTTALLKDNTAANQKLLLTLVVNTVVIGNYTQPNVGITVPGILAAGTFNGQPVNLLQYFDAQGPTTNVNGIPTHQSFLDGGGAAPLKMNMPASDTTSNQYFLLTHLYEYFGTLLGCSQQSPNDKGDFPAYAGVTGMNEVHKFMNLNQYEVGYFIKQVALSAASFGAADADVIAVASALMDLFGYECLPPRGIVVPLKEAQSICTDQSNCMSNEHSNCSNPAYANAYLIDSILRAIHPNAMA